jgi:UDP-N-acetylglucosamine 4,6-dehydratase/5-epimerase
MNVFKDKIILITGGSGSFGNAYAKLLLTYDPKKVIIYSRDEYKQYTMSKSLDDSRLRFFIGDVRDSSRLDEAFKGVDYVIHAAALKQVDTAEYNPSECVNTNVNGAKNVISAAIKNNVKKVIALSTDKAVNPINLYGATKLVSDKLFIAANNISGNCGTRFSVVRYGNVLNSRGSVVPYFKKLLSDGVRVLPVTDPKMTRFIITMDHALSFVDFAFYRMQGAETFVPKIPSIRILDLVEAMSGSRLYDIVGLRSGEKIDEVMCPAELSSLTLESKDSFIIKPTINMFDKDLEYEGVVVPDNFEYNSGTNSDFLTVEEIKAMIYEDDTIY